MSEEDVFTNEESSAPDEMEGRSRDDRISERIRQGCQFANEFLSVVSGINMEEIEEDVGDNLKGLIERMKGFKLDFRGSGEKKTEGDQCRRPKTNEEKKTNETKTNASKNQTNKKAKQRNLTKVYEKKGEIPKGCKKESDRRESTDSDTINSDSDESVTQNDSSSDSIEENEQSVLSSTKTKVKSEDILIKLLQHVDSRKIPQLEKYDADTEELETFLREFEKYCKTNIKGGDSYWFKELENLLTGDTLKVYLALREKKDSYKTLKKKLIEWHNGMKDLRKVKSRELFFKFSPNEDEGLFIFSSRLEAQFKIAFPKIPMKRLQTSETLQRKFLDHVPLAFRELIESKDLAMKVEGQKLRWDMIQKYARVTDIELMKKKKNNASSEKSSEIIINVQNKADKEEPRTQTKPQQERNDYDVRRSPDSMRNMNAFENRDKNHPNERDRNYHREYSDNRRAEPRYDRYDRDRYYNREFSQDRRSTPRYDRNNNRHNENRQSYYQRGEERKTNYQDRRERGDRNYPQYKRNQNNEYRNAPRGEARKDGRYETNQNTSKIPNIPNFECFYCGRKGHTANVCRVRLNLCSICNKPNHSKENCYYNKNNNNNQSRQEGKNRPEANLSHGQRPNSPPQDKNNYRLN